MASHGTVPTLDLAAGGRILDEDLPRILRREGAATPEDLGWKRVDGRTLLVPVKGESGGVVDEFCLRLEFKTGRDWPPSAQFVNPETLDYDPETDTRHLPRVNNGEVQVHPGYARPGGGKMQLICCSATLEYYQVLHGGENRHLWKETDDFMLTITAIRRAMGESYQGRHE
jgi:hypothetical protein